MLDRKGISKTGVSCSSAGDSLRHAVYLRLPEKKKKARQKYFHSLLEKLNIYSDSFDGISIKVVTLAKRNWFRRVFLFSDMMCL